MRSEQKRHESIEKRLCNSRGSQMAQRAFIPSMDHRFAYINDIPKHKRPDILHFSHRKQYYQLQKIKPTGLSSWKTENLTSTLAVKIGRTPDLRWKVGFGPGSYLSKSGRSHHHYGHARHPHWATIKAAMKALDTVQKICASNPHIVKIVIVTESAMLVNILAWGKNARHELAAAGFPPDMVAAYHEIKHLINSIECHGHRFVSFWYKP